MPHRPSVPVPHVRPAGRYALNTTKLKEKSSDTSIILNEVNFDYSRAMNKIIFDRELKNAAKDNPLLHALAMALPPEVPKKIAGEVVKVMLPRG